LPNTSTVWGDIDVEPGVLVCPTKGKTQTIGYDYYYYVGGQSIGTFDDPTTKLLTFDGNLSGGVNVGKFLADFDLRHSGKMIASYADGHVNATIAPLDLLLSNPSELFLVNDYNSSTGDWKASVAQTANCKWSTSFWNGAAYAVPNGSAQVPQIGSLGNSKGINMRTPGDGICGFYATPAAIGVDLGNDVYSFTYVENVIDDGWNILFVTNAGSGWRFTRHGSYNPHVLQTAGAPWVNMGWTSAGPPAICNSNMPAGKPYVVSYVFSPTILTVYLNGIKCPWYDGVSRPNSNVGPVGASTMMGLGLNTGVPGGTIRINNSQSRDLFRGLIGDMVFYNRVVSDADRTLAESCLANKYGITLGTL
jgi:prepilin-type processing-associated H-X9-DG protein